MLKRLPLSSLVLLALLWLGLTTACRKDAIDRNSSSKLSFSQDTVLFDTVFTTIGSSTQWMLVRNNNSKKLVISSIRLAGGANSNFRINVNGQSGKEFTDLEIAAKDSMYIFVEVTIDPNRGTTPLIVTDSIVFETNSNIQDVKLVAWGQDAYFHTPVKGSFLSPLHSCTEVWNKDKPHVIYGYFFVDSACSLTINPGAKVYIHGGSGMLVYKDATLIVNGTAAEPVIIHGDRLESSYSETPGQWDRIWFYAGSINSRINHAQIINGNVGLQCDTTGNSSNPTLTISNSIVRNMTGAGLYAQDSKVEASNTVFANCGIHCVLLSIGGDYSFRHCTLGDWWSGAERKTPLLGINNYYEDVNSNIQTRALTRAYFGNCIIYGNLKKEIGFDYDERADFNYQFDYCLFKTDSALDSQRSRFPSKFNGNLLNINPLFTDTTKHTLTLQDGSPAIDAGAVSVTQMSPAISLDIEDHPRVGGSAPDLGAYEK